MQMIPGDMTVWIAFGVYLIGLLTGFVIAQVLMDR